MLACLLQKLEAYERQHAFSAIPTIFGSLSNFRKQIWNHSLGLCSKLFEPFYLVRGQNDTGRPKKSVTNVFVASFQVIFFKNLKFQQIALMAQTKMMYRLRQYEKTNEANKNTFYSFFPCHISFLPSDCVYLSFSNQCLSI